MTAWLKANLYWIIACAVLAACGYGAGRYLSPVKEEWRSIDTISTYEVEKVVERIVRVEGPVRTVTRTVERLVPSECAGTPPVILVDTVVEEDRGTTTVATDRTGDRELDELGVSATEKIVTRDAPRLTLLGTIGTDITNLKPVYGGFVAARIAGPITVGAGFDSSLRATVAAGLTF